MARRYHSKKIRDIGKYRRLGHVLIGESNVAIDPAIGGYGVADSPPADTIYHHDDLGEFPPQSAGPGAGVRCGNGFFPLINPPTFILASLY